MSKPAKCKTFFVDAQKNPDAKWLYEMFLSGKFDVHNPPSAKQLSSMDKDIKDCFAVYNQKSLTKHIKDIACDVERIKLQQAVNGIDVEDI